ncbi:hypothetical protein D7B24_003807 [Verticillium nonalfalfae]|uniref:Rhodopsin domain-containing protein n=1 Tax=Verticillium nonalfalfae TaxID=1051616 RepID=A0A3M9YGT1_9PEZI|nr:uncharacterized protein D7B24_003807 [Verticillium nonalfalfae]RNJ58986.1 hypothetical protein D7B24_003807 [Verticillium nonalfalfae]
MTGSEKGQAALAVMWTLTAITLVFLCLRLVTRYFIIDQLGFDDYTYVVAAILLVLYTTFTHVAEGYGFGRSIYGLEIKDATAAIKWEMVGQSFSIIGMAVSKISLGLFLLRLTVVHWHRVAIWTVMGVLLADSIATVISFWFQCNPPRAIFDLELRPTAKCDWDITPVAVTLGVCCVISDFFFAAFPTLIVWDLKMKRKEKIFIAVSMGLGVIAAAAGIVRTYEVATGFTENYTEDTVPLIVWSCAEQSVTMICIGIPLLRPLYRHVLKRDNLSTSSKAQYHKYSEGTDKESYKMRGISKKERAEGSTGGKEASNASLGLDSQTVTDIGALNNNSSNEHILGIDTIRNSSDAGSSGNRLNRGIRVKEDVQVEWSNR